MALTVQLVSLALVLVLSVGWSVTAKTIDGLGCPYLNGGGSSLSASSAHSASPPTIFHGLSSPLSNGAAKRLGLTPAGGALSSNLDFDLVAADIQALLTNSQSFWPADFGNYGPFFIRQAWHCAGSYRNYDGRGGCDGGRQRFNPELSWADNTNLDKAKTLLAPIKEKYGAALSWGDLIILTGDVAIASMGGPILGFCGGRIDDWNGDASILLGPTTEQAATFPCPVNGECKAPLGPTTVGLIYVNPEGPMAQPIPAGSAPQIRDTFARMGMDDNETVALIGGGHAFGKAHGACSLGAGPSPLDQPLNPWPGLCGDGKGLNASTAGFEGSWTTTPTKWSNEFFQNLLKYEWTNYTGPGGHQQWKPTNASAPPLMMLTSDVSLTVDPAFRQIVEYFANNADAFASAFSHAWYKLVTRDMGPVTRCLGKRVPPAQPFQNPLPAPPPPQQLADVNTVKGAIRLIMTSKNSALTPDTDPVTMMNTYRGYFVDLAFQCASTFRQTDYLGGCNGARIRLQPQAGWPVNKGLDDVLNVLQTVMLQFPAGSLSWADLIVLAGNVALEDASNGQMSLPFCTGRTDAVAGDAGSAFLQPWDDGNFQLSVSQLNQFASLLNMSAQEIVLLSARIRSPNRLINTFGFSGSYPSALSLSKDYFSQLVNQFWVPSTSASGKHQYQAQGISNSFLTINDIQLKQEPEYRPFVEYYAAANAQQFYQDFAVAWTKLMTADRFAGPGVNGCGDASPSNPDASSTSNPDPYLVAGVSVAATIVACALVFVCYLKTRRPADSSSYQIQP